MLRIGKWPGMAFVVLVLGIQFIRPEKTNPPVVQAQTIGRTPIGLPKLRLFSNAPAGIATPTRPNGRGTAMWLPFPGLSRIT